ncbi:amidohydrolase [Phaeobacter gallaeciensis]|uniref:Amidohydrolase n=1 Tax=Phaeobacter gallaeciensis TaxID=60890 RepID=A0AAD0ECN2_9RHOB|nr:amidohydrolase [Phaeobacter gallaeciensis]AHD09188.1 putative metal-dependent hydrolase with the TIM-barrel fold protein [Phaeobacter gallaeciensis DSM 26640]ATE92451.1 putative amidohydrolase [Phaeobacter gallaeciensis]ATE97727.1 putative amidohydrolase [Phaeobacter gallaeciensis]ATF01116.1 putative amidohydrolase [Phaeobacter gallaeciensis]ATF05496.1 putative amidohydrolase [Phaeobacter gallaeciensis]
MVSSAGIRSTNTPEGLPAAELVLLNGRIYTVDTAQPWAEAVAIKHGRFIAVGSNADMEPLIADYTHVHDLQGAFAMPGLYDMHTHPDLALGPKYSDYLDVGLETPTPEQVRDAILAYAGEHPGDGWIFGKHFVHYGFRKAGLQPGRDWLDSFIPDRPVAIMDRMWGSCMANSKALELAGVSKDTVDPNNGYIVRDPLTGKPDGILVDGAYALIMAAMPPPPMHALTRAYREGARFQSARGVVATKYVHVCERRLDALRAIDLAGDLPVRVEAAISWQDDIFPVRRRWELLAGERHYYRSKRLNANAVKFHFDGTSEPRTSYLIAPWPNEKTWQGSLNLTPEHIYDMVAEMDRKRIRVIAHCTGDGASDIFLDAVAECRRRNGVGGMRHQCAHSTLLDEGNLARFAELDVIAEFSPVGWFPSEFTIGARSSFGERLQEAYNVRGVLDAGGVTVMGTDWPVSSIDPWFGFETLVTRENPRAEMEGRLGQSITPQEAIRMLTINGACAMGCEDVSGSITTGKTADIIVLDRNLLEIEVKGNWHKSQVRLTMVDGEVVHDPEGWMQGAEFESRITSPVPDFIPADI